MDRRQMTRFQGCLSYVVSHWTLYKTDICVRSNWLYNTE